MEACRFNSLYLHVKLIQQNNLVPGINLPLTCLPLYIFMLSLIADSLGQLPPILQFIDKGLQYRQANLIYILVFEKNNCLIGIAYVVDESNRLVAVLYRLKTKRRNQ